MQNFKQFLKDHAMTQQELADKLGVHQTLISQWCHGKTKPSIYQVRDIARHVGVSIEAVMACFEKENVVQTQ